MAEIEVRTMREADLDSVMDITNAAFTALIEGTYGRKPPSQLFPSLMGRYRLALDPMGCHVAVAEGAVVGANFSVLRGSLGWFGPLAVRPDFQGGGVAQRLVSRFITSAKERGATLLGLETIANSPQHVHLYMKLGFQPSWTGIGYRRQVRDVEVPPGVEVDGRMPDVGYVYPGFDATKDAGATKMTGAGVTLTAGQGFAVCHVHNTLWADATSAYVPLILAPDRKTFDSLVVGVEAIARRGGKATVSTQVPGSSVTTQQALLEHGYRTGGAALRMKQGEHADYDGKTIYYCDDWH